MVLHLRVPAPNNWDGAKCAGQVQRLPGEDDVYDPFFHEDDDGHHDLLAEQDAIDFCNGTIDGNVCPLREGCLLYASTNNERFGVWGGMSEADRKIMRKIWPWRAGKEPRPEWRWFSHDEITELLDDRIRRGEINIRQLVEEDDEDEAE